VGEIRVDVALVRTLLEGWNTSLISIEDGVALLQTDVGKLAVNLTATRADVAAVTGDVAIIQTDVGRIAVDLQYAQSVLESGNNTVVDLAGDVATMMTALGTLEGVLTEVQDDLALVETELGLVTARLLNYGGASGVTYISITDLAILAFFGGIFIMILILLWSTLSSGFPLRRLN